MPSKRKSRRTHIFQRTTRASRARVKKASKGNHVQSEETEAHDESVDENLHQDRQVDEQVDENEENTVNTECELEKEVDSNILDTADVQDGPEKHGKKITETNIENKNKSNSETPVLVYRHKRISRRSHHYKSYSHEMLVAAYKCVKELKMPVKTAARVFGVPSSTLHNRVQGQVQIDDSIISLEDIHKIVNRLKKGDPLEDVFADLNYERAHCHAVNADHTAEKEDSSNDDSITESILKKMNSDIKEEVMDPEYECQMNESESSTSDLNSIVDTDNSELASAERMKRAYKRNYKTYSYEQLVAAYLYVKEKKVAVKFAARAFGVPPSTLNDRVQGKVFIDTSIVMNNPKGRKILPQPQFNKNKVNTWFIEYFFYDPFIQCLGI